jgi:hypothetical protein
MKLPFKFPERYEFSGERIQHFHDLTLQNDLAF